MGVQVFVLSENYDSLAEQWRGLASADIHKRILADSEELLSSIHDKSGKIIGTWARCASGADLQALEKRANFDFGGSLVVAASDWSIIPAENLVAAFQNSDTKLMMAAETAEEGRTLLGALEIGVDGVVLCTDDLSEIRSLHTFVEQLNRRSQCVDLETATVTRVEAVGMGDRVCVDLCANMRPGEGMLVGNFCRTLFLVHSECAESAYINSRPFRVNAGPVHAYTAVSGGKTAYLAELKAGQEVLVVDTEGMQRSEVVGRCKVERRPLVLVAAESSDGIQHSILLQNAETVKLVGPLEAGEESSSRADKQQWQTIPVTEIRPGDKVHVKRDEAGIGRHMGTAVQETLNEW